MHRFGRVGLTLSLCLVLLVVSLIPDLISPRPVYAAGNAGPPLPAAEDPLGQQPEQQVPESSINVDVRDGHLTVRVIDIWGPRRVPHIVRSYTNTDLTATAGPGNWQFNQHLDVLPVTNEDGSVSFKVREPDGNRGVYRFSHQVGSGASRTNVYVKDVGSYSTLEAPMTCTNDGENPGQWTCNWAGTFYTVYLPKGVTRKFNKNAAQAGGTGFTRALIAEERDANGNVTTFAWTTFPDGGTRGYVSTVTDPVGRQTNYGYERGVQECTERGEQGIPVCVWSYRVRTATDPYGRTATYTYNASQQIISAVNPAGFITSYGYSGELLTSVTNARGHTSTLQWTSDPRVSRVTAADGSATVYAYTATGSRVMSSTMTDALAHATVYNMYGGGDPNYFGNLERVTDPFGNVTLYAYDARHNVTQVTDARGNVTTYAYSSRNKVAQILQAAGSLNLTTTLSWNNSDNLLSLTNPRGIRTDYNYNGNRNLTSVRKAVGTVDEALTQYTYTTWGDVASMIDPRGHTTSYTYTTRWQLASVIPPAGGTTSFGYNAMDDQVSMTDGNGRTWSTAYDARRLVTSVTDPLNNVVRHESDANGNRTRTYDARNYPTTFAYDNRDRLTSITDAANGVTSYTYDAVSNLTRITNARNFPTNFSYDSANRLTQVTDALGQSTTYGYDQVGNKTSMRDRKSQLFSYSYDQANRLTQVSGGGLTITSAYDTNGNRTSIADATGTTTYAYNSLDRLTRTTYPDGLSVQTTYDRAGNRTSLTNPGGLAMNALYDTVNRLTELTQGALSWTFVYDGAGNRTQITQPNGTSTTYAYLNNNWLSSVTHRAPGGGTLQSVSYTSDANGNRISQADSSGTTTVSYDALNRLTQAAYPGKYGTWSWTYDAVGNRTSQTAPSGTTNYTHDGNNRLTQAGGTAFSYDANGNLTGISTGQTFTYDALNRLTQATGSGGTVSYTYNGDGLKVRRAGPDGVTRYYHDGIRPIWETDDARTMTSQLDRDIFGNLLSRREPSGARRYIHPDGLGSTTLLTDESGASAATMLYDAWGQVRSNSGSVHGKYRFTGAELDMMTGLYHMGARFYDPTVGRWLSEDPVQDNSFDPASLNFYTYVKANPLGLIDPDGNWGIPGPILDILKEVKAQLERVSSMAGPGGLLALTAVAGSIGAFSSNASIATTVGASISHFGVGAYSVQQSITRGWNHLIEAHHIIPARFAALFSVRSQDMPAVILPGSTHRAIESAIQSALRPGVNYTREQVIQILRQVYGRYAPELVRFVNQFVNDLFSGNG